MNPRRSILARRAASLLALLCLAAAAPAPCAEKYALLVGINEYPGFQDKNLEGCLNDVKLFKNLLVLRFGFKEDNIRVLTNGQATAEGIGAAFQESLVGRSRPGDLAVFYYSGHGAQVKDADGDETDGRDEILCTHDIRVVDGKLRNYITDDALNGMVKRLAGRDVLCVLDCCHSGTGMRDLLCGGRVRYLSLGGEPAPAAGMRSLLTDRFDAPPPSSVPAPAAMRGLVLGGGAVLIAACQANETAQEGRFKVNGNPEHHGALTYKLAEGLAGEVGAAARLTYADLKRFLAEPLITEDREQHPQIECAAGLLERKILAPSSAAPEPEPAPAASSGPQPALEMHSGRQPLSVYAAPFETFIREQPSRQAESKAGALRAILGRQPGLTLAGRRDESDVNLFVALSSGPLTVGTITPGGSITSRVSVDTLDEASLKPILNELRRTYLVRNLLALRNPAAPRVNVELPAGGRTLGLGRKIAFRITSPRDGYLTLINVDCQGGVTLLVPNQYQPECPVRAGQALDVPTLNFDLEVQLPVGRETIKAIVSRRPLILEQFAKSEAAEAGPFRSIGSEADATQLLDGMYRKIVVKKKTSGQGATAATPSEAGVGIDQLAPEDWSEGALTFFTAQ